MENPNDTSWRIIDYAFSVLGGFAMVIWSLINSKVNKNDEVLNRRIDDTIRNVKDHDRIFDKLFEQMKHSSERSEDRHAELLTAIHTGLAAKQDK